MRPDERTEKHSEIDDETQNQRNTRKNNGNVPRVSREVGRNSGYRFAVFCNHLPSYIILIVQGVQVRAMFSRDLASHISNAFVVTEGIAVGCLCVFM